jgi:transcriptional regulator with XRE-family HTH domain
MLKRSILEVKPPQKFGRNLARVRSACGITQEELAERADIHARYLQKLEAGAEHPSLIVLCRLKRALGCHWDDLLAKVEG